MKIIFIILCFCVLPASVLAGNTLTIKLLDKASNSPVADAYIYASDNNGKSTGAVSDDNGTAKLMLGSGEYTIYISHIQYETQQTSIRL
ncbi:MAG: carboxypeptidase regulatory-like domain-containing protein, partial [Bacteroidales bacterium]|nr:carboxypeptidase regulatory-like domain-containing protein [Bacteroidales bacterium]